MKFRESGMPAQEYWETLFDVEGILDAFEIGSQTGPVVELGCGYGTFSLPVAKRTGAVVYAFDIEETMVDATERRASAAGLSKIMVERRDVFAEGFGLPDGSCDACLLFNILHGEDPVTMLREGARVVKDDGFVAVIHWRRDIQTPRGPGMDIRPGPGQVAAWAYESKRLQVTQEPIILRPWHWGLKLVKRREVTI